MPIIPKPVATTKSRTEIRGFQPKNTTLDKLANDRSINPSAFDIHSLMMIQAAQWAADMELEACCELVDQDPHSAQTLRRERRSLYGVDTPHPEEV